MLFATVLLALSLSPARGQTTNPPTDKEFEEADRLFKQGNTQLKKKEFADALKTYQSALKIIPDDESLLYNGGFAALLAKDFTTAISLLKQLKQIDLEDWQTRAKLIQAYQGLNKTLELNIERDELFALRKKGTVKILNEQPEYCRDRFEAGGQSVMAFEHFELVGDRALRYVFSIMDADGEKEISRISLGSYELTNAIWRETTKPEPKPGERLFHLDGYFENGGHATYGMYTKEPTYEETKKIVMGILEGQKKPLSSTTPVKTPAAEPAKKP